jgi:integrase
VGASKEVINLTSATETKTVVREGTATGRNVDGQVGAFEWYMTKQGYREQTVQSRAKLLKRLLKLGASLDNPDSVKDVIARQHWCQGRKANCVDTYTSYLKMNGKTWDAPIYKGIPKDGYFPLARELDDLIAGCSKRMSAFLLLLRETGARAGEIWTAKWEDIDVARKLIRVTPEKESDPRTSHLTQRLIDTLLGLPKNYGDRIFSRAEMPLDHHGDHFRQQRERLAKKLRNPNLMRITFKTFRTWKATWTYRRMGYLEARKALGHRSPRTTERYIRLGEQYFGGEDDYDSRVAMNVKQAQALVEQGYEYVTGEYDDGGKIFKKRKQI